MFECMYLYVIFRPRVEHGGDVTSVMDGDEKSSVNKQYKDQVHTVDLNDATPTHFLSLVKTNMR